MAVNGALSLPMAYLIEAGREVRHEHEEKVKRFDEAVPDIPDTAPIS
jgi:hypothetical protein